MQTTRLVDYEVDETSRELALDQNYKDLGGRVGKRDFLSIRNSTSQNRIAPDAWQSSNSIASNDTEVDLRSAR